MLPRGRFRRSHRGKMVWKYASQCKDCERPGKAARAAVRRSRAIGSFKASDVVAQLKRQAWACRGCGADMTVTGFHVDHRVPLAKGGSNTADNIQCLCPTCNLRKGAK